MRTEKTTLDIKWILREKHRYGKNFRWVLNMTDSKVYVHGHI